MPSETKQQVAKSTSEPWAPQQPFIKETMSEAQKLYNAPGPSYFPGSTVAGFSPEQQQAQQMGTQRATQGNAGMGMAQGYNNDVLQGKYLEDPNEGMMFQNIQQRVLPSVNSQFMGSGRSGSGLHADTAARGLTEAYAPYATQMRQYGLGQMDAAATRAPTYAANDYTDINALGAIGQQKQDLAQNELGDAVNRFNFYQDLPANKLAQYSRFIGGNYGGTNTSSTPYQQQSPWAALGGAALTAAPYILSDVRAKKNIRRVGELDSGIPIYNYQYKGSDMSQIGVLAQEAERTRPDAIHTDERGVKFVNYDRLV